MQSEQTNIGMEKNTAGIQGQLWESLKGICY